MAKKRPTKTKHVLLTAEKQRELERARRYEFNHMSDDKILGFVGNLDGLTKYLDRMIVERRRGALENAKKQTKKN